MKLNLLFYLLMCVFPGLPPSFLWSDTSCPQVLESLEAQVWDELEKVNIPSLQWILHPYVTEDKQVLDVAIIGGGMSGMTSCLALIKEGVTRVKIFDENDPGREGPWAKCARMPMLRSGKYYMGPALGIPSLTFKTWFEAQYGAAAWLELKSIPTNLWCNYLCWFRRVLKLPVKNKLTLTKLTPLENCFELTFNSEEETKVFYARKVVLATGREGGGGLEIPEFMKTVSKNLYAHTGEIIDPETFYNKKIAVIGTGASAFDAAAVALENGAKSVEMLVRRSAVPKAHIDFFYPGIVHGFYLLPDEKRCQFFAESAKHGNPPPKDAIKRVQNYDNFQIHFDTRIEHVTDDGTTAILQTNKGTKEVDFIICGTGYRIDISKRSELKEINPYILLWENRVPYDLLQQFPKLGRFPYLGPNFEFLEAEPGTAPFLKNIHCFNYGAFLSHGLLSGDIPLISIGATRLAQGIASDFFLQHHGLYFEKMKASGL